MLRKITLYCIVLVVGTLGFDTFCPVGIVQQAGTIQVPITTDNANGLTELEILHRHNGPIWGLVFSPDGSLLASSGGYDDNTIRLWNMENITELSILTQNSWATSLAFSPDGLMLAAGECEVTSANRCNRILRLWDVSSGRGHVLSEGYPNEIIRVLFSPDGDTLAVVGGDGVAELWDVTEYIKRIDFPVYGVINITLIAS